MPIIGKIQLFGNQIKASLKSIIAPHLAYLLKVADESAYEDDLGMFMLAKGTLKIPNSSSKIRPEAQLLRAFSLKPRELYPACGSDETSVKAFNVPPEWKSQLEKMNVEVRRGFARALIYWGLQIPPYALPSIRFVNNDLPGTFRDYIKAYCARSKQVPATAIAFLNNHPASKGPLG